MTNPPKNKKSGYHFGTFQGVFTPNILTILGIIMYLRSGWVLAHAGLVKTLVIVTLSTVITLLTSLSISQLATNAKVGSGGAYYIISRSLGPQAGAAIGIPLFLGQALSIAFYVIGFSESLGYIFPEFSVKTLALLSLLALMLIALISADFVLKIQLFIMAGIALSLVSFFMGGAEGIEASAPPEPFVRESFWTVFAVFFPAVTGILSGLSMSGDLKSPSKALPYGTIGSVLVSYGVYMAIPLFLNHLKISPEVLNSNPFIMKHVARWGSLIWVGLWGASLSSALGSILGAPRTLQALANDSIVFKVLGRGYGKNRDPRGALFLSCFLAFGAVLAGNLDLIASLLTMFFLTTYGLLNFSAAIEGLIQNPSWRPSFKVHWGFPLAGAVGCLIVMLLINVVATIMATLISGGIYFLMHKRKMNAYWGDMKYAILMLVSKFSIYRLIRFKAQEKSWRPNILVLSGAPTSRWHLIAMADALSHGKGFLTVAALLTGEVSDEERIDNMRKSIQEYLADHDIPAIVRIQRVDDKIFDGARHMVEYYGFGPLVPNTILLGITEKKENELNFSELLLTASRKKKNIILVREADDLHELKTLKIDIWWRRGGNNAGLMLALGYLLMTSPEWRGAKLTLKSLLAPGEDQEQEKERLKKFLTKANIEAEIEMICQDSSPAFRNIQISSSQADLVLLGLRKPDTNETAADYAQYYSVFLANLAGFPATALVLASEDIDFQKIFELHETTL